MPSAGPNVVLDNAVTTLMRFADRPDDWSRAAAISAFVALSKYIGQRRAEGWSEKAIVDAVGEITASRARLDENTASSGRAMVAGGGTVVSMAGAVLAQHTEWGMFVAIAIGAVGLAGLIWTRRGGTTVGALTAIDAGIADLKALRDRILWER